MTRNFYTEQFIPSTIKSSKRKDGVFNEYPCELQYFGDTCQLIYKVPVSNQQGPTGKTREIYSALPASITLDVEDFEIIGFLQGEMSKTHRGPVTITNSEPHLMKRTLLWFEKHFGISPNDWHWYLRANITQPEEEERVYLEELLTAHWSFLCDLPMDTCYPKGLTFVKNTNNKTLKNQGSLMIERRDNVFVQTLHRFLEYITTNVDGYSEQEINAYMRGVLAAESCVNFRIASGHRRIFITAVKDEEREIFMQCIKHLGVEYKECKPIKDIIISGRENLELVDALGLMCLHPGKHERFCEMMASYKD